MFAEQIKRARLAHKLTQRELAKRCGLTQPQISLMERGNVDPQVSNLVQVARVLDLEPMLVPKQWAGFVKGLQMSDETAHPARPAYRIENDDHG